MNREDSIEYLMRLHHYDYEAASLHYDAFNEAQRRRLVEGKKTASEAMQHACFNYIKKTFPKIKLENEYTIKNKESKKPNSYYRIDIYCPEYNLAIEVDEYGHAYYNSSYVEREKYIRNEIGCDFIRFAPYSHWFSINDIIEKLNDFFQLTPPEV